jgi:hypothetical protein
MSEIPADVMEAAKEAYERYGGVAYNSLDLIDSIARAILAERKRCAKRYAYEAMRSSVGMDLAKSVRFDGLLIIVHPDMPPHVWDGEKMSKMEIGIDLAEKPGPYKPTNLASTSPGPVNCSIRLRHQGKLYPRTCERCGLGPCPFFHKDGTAK